MISVKGLVTAAAMTATLVTSTPVFSDSITLPANSPLKDRQVSEEELAGILAAAQTQLIRLTDEATKAYRGQLTDARPNMPSAWMLMKDGTTVKRLSLGEQGAEVPASARIYMYRAAIKAIAQGGEINAAAILYTGRVSPDSEVEALVIEHEHRLGVSANKVIGFTVEGEDLRWAEPVSQSKPFEWFYDQESKKG